MTICRSDICSEEGGASRCERCGALVCMCHGVNVGEHTFCPRHRMRGYWLAFWGLLR